MKRISEESVRAGNESTSPTKTSTINKRDDSTEISDNSGDKRGWHVVHGASEMRWEDQSHHFSSTFSSASSFLADSKTRDRKNEVKKIAANLLAAEEALQRLQHIFPDQSYELPLNFPKFKRSELVIGSRLGKGSFSVVDEVLKISVDDDYCVPQEQPSSCQGRAALLLSSKQASRTFVSSRCRSEYGEMRYCVKEL